MVRSIQNILSLICFLITTASAHAGTEFVLENVSRSQNSCWRAISTTAARTDGLKVTWWNIANGMIGSEGNGLILAKNIDRLISSPLRPHVIALGEYQKGSLPEQTIENLKRIYPYSTFIPYNEQTDVGMVVFTNLPLKVGRQTTLKWIPEHIGEQQRRDYLETWSSGDPEHDEAFYTRSVRELEIIFENRKIAIVPVHLAQPWRQLRERSQGRVDFMMGMAKELFLSGSNPLITQVNSLDQWLSESKLQDRIVLGDFNLPRGIFGVPTLGYRRLVDTMAPAIRGEQPSFPAPSSPHREPPTQIDHAFLAGGLSAEAGVVAPLKGSDHLPVYVIIQPGS